MLAFPAQRRLLPLLALLTIVPFLVLYYNTTIKEAWRGLPQKVGLGDAMPEARPSSASSIHQGDGGAAAVAEGEDGQAAAATPLATSKWSSVPHFSPGAARPADYVFNTTLVVPRTSSEDTEWMAQHLAGVNLAIYTADDPGAPLHPPKNKGHEVMIYLSWIIDNYAALPDVAIFMHAHRYAWHNDELLDYDAVQMLRRLNPHRVQRQGYVNMRCHWDPGCPDWMHPGEVEDDINKQEQKLLAKAWSELFPLDPIPDTLAQPCCSQFALSRDRIRAIPLARFTSYRDWLLRTTLSDYFSGRVWEYLWQWVFTGEAVHCPAQHVCYCDGFGVCFGGAARFDEWLAQKEQLRALQAELDNWTEKDDAVSAAMAEGELEEESELEVPELGAGERLRSQVEELRGWLEQSREEAVKRGKDPKLRAEECGRAWNEGDGF